MKLPKLTITINKYGLSPYKACDSTKRLFYIDILLLNHVISNQICYSHDLYCLLSKRRSRRTINKHLNKLVSLNLLERHGNVRCPYQSYSIPQHNKQQVIELIRAIEPYFIAQKGKGLRYVTLQVLLDQVLSVSQAIITIKYKNARYLLYPPRIYSDESRPFNCSIPNREKGGNSQTHLLNFTFKVLSQSTLRDFKRYPQKTFNFFEKAKNAKEKVLSSKNTGAKTLLDFVKKYFRQSKIHEFQDPG